MITEGVTSMELSLFQAIELTPVTIAKNLKNSGNAFIAFKPKYCVNVSIKVF